MPLVPLNLSTCHLVEDPARLLGRVGVRNGLGLICGLRIIQLGALGPLSVALSEGEVAAYTT